MAYLVFLIVKISAIADYHQNAQNFNPTAYNPRQWATLAKSLGLQYVILTTKHHDGYALFPTKTSNFSFGSGDRPFSQTVRQSNA